MIDFQTFSQPARSAYEIAGSLLLFHQELVLLSLPTGSHYSPAAPPKSAAVVFPGLQCRLPL